MLPCAPRRLQRALVALAAALGLAAAIDADAMAELLAADDPAASTSLADMSLEQLGSILVTSVSRRSQPWSEAAASIYVIGQQDIHRAGAFRLPEALRLAPNLHVAQADANQYAVSARGFNSVLTNKMLVLIDGRTVYSPLFSGVFWEAQDVQILDVDRIEVVSGPGGTLWGTNAVNGVINVITRSASDTRGLLAGAGAGDEARRASARWGGPLGAASFRVYGTWHDQENTELASGTPVRDASERFHAGFRADGGDRNPWTLSGGSYRVDIDQAPEKRIVSGTHLLANWTRSLGERSTLRMQGYFDHSEREQPGAIHERLNTLEVEAQHAFRAWNRHEFVWGAGYRHQPDRVENLNPAAFAFIPADRDLRYTSVFAQDDVRLNERLQLILGLRLEHNVYTDWEYLPTARLSWRPADARLLWGAVSRAVRAPSRVDREFFIPGTPPHFFAGGPAFESEVANVLEIGYRAQPTPAVSYSITGFHHDYDRLRSSEPTSGGFMVENRIEGRNTGVEGWGQVRLLDSWRVSAGVVRQSKILDADDSGDPSRGAALGNDPDFWWTLRSSMDLGVTATLDLMLRHVGALPVPEVPAYGALDARLGWNVLRTVELSVAVQNLLGSGHPEWGTAGNRAEFDRNVFVRAVWRM